jgi:hypothetical protein
MTLLKGATLECCAPYARYINVTCYFSAKHMFLSCRGCVDVDDNLHDLRQLINISGDDDDVLDVMDCLLLRNVRTLAISSSL